MIHPQPLWSQAVGLFSTSAFAGGVLATAASVKLLPFGVGTLFYVMSLIVAGAGVIVLLGLWIPPSSKVRSVPCWGLVFTVVQGATGAMLGSCVHRHPRCDRCHVGVLPGSTNTPLLSGTVFTLPYCPGLLTFSYCPGLCSSFAHSLAVRVCDRFIDFITLTLLTLPYCPGMCSHFAHSLAVRVCVRFIDLITLTLLATPCCPSLLTLPCRTGL